MATPKFKPGDRVKIKKDYEGEYIDPDNPFWSDEETVAANVYIIDIVSAEWGMDTYYEVIHPDDNDHYEWEIYESHLTKERVRPPTKREMAALYKSLGVEV